MTRSLLTLQCVLAQVTTALKVGEMWDHNGTYMEGIGFLYRDHQVIVEVSDDGQLAGDISRLHFPNQK